MISDDLIDDVLATTDTGKDIKPINKDTVHRICSGQVVLNLGVAVKELVENSIDAGATLVEVRLREQGMDQIDVIDNGCGVEESNFEGLTAKYHTSKIREFADLAGVTTFGFRGEALSSLCSLADMVVTTRHVSAAVATRLELDHNGVIAKRSACARQTGTTITLTNLFGTLPVRKREFTKNIKREFARMCQLLQGYCLVTRNVRIICSNQTKKGAKTTIMATSGASTYMENITAIFGPRQKTDLLELSSTAAEEAENGFKLEGWISSCMHGSGRSSRDRQFVYVNARPCEPKSLIKTINEVYRRYNVHQSPFVFLNVVVARREVDVNLTPDKRQLLVNNENRLIDVLKVALQRAFGDVPSTFKMHNLDVSTKPTVASKSEQSLDSILGGDDDGDDELLKPNAKKFSKMLDQWKRTGRTDEPCQSSPASARAKRKNVPTEIEVRNVRMKTMQSYLQKDADSSDMISNSSDSRTYEPCDSHVEAKDDLESSDIFEQTSEPEPDANHRVICKVETPNTERKLKLISADSPLLLHSPPKNVHKSRNQANKSPTKSPDPSPDRGISPIPFVLDDTESESEPENMLLGFKSQATSGMSNELSVTIDQIEAMMLAEKDEKTKQKLHKASLERLRFKAAIDPSKNSAAEQELQREISKSDFCRMQIIGQFNLGFVVVRLDDDLFIVDQHASDEKYNFEMLQRTTQLQNQPMVRPQPLDLTAVNEMVLIDNREIFEMNGFKFEIDPQAEPTHKCKLVAKPFSKNWEFGKEDIDELIFMLHDCPNNSVMCRPSRIRSMFASRACRKSVMVGTALTVPKMKRLVEQMAEIDHPWNCPHGRPTMRHLLNLAMLEEIDADGQ